MATAADSPETWLLSLQTMVFAPDVAKTLADAVTPDNSVTLDDRTARNGVAPDNRVTPDDRIAPYDRVAPNNRIVPNDRVARNRSMLQVSVLACRVIHNFRRKGIASKNVGIV